MNGGRELARRVRPWAGAQPGGAKASVVSQASPPDSLGQ